MYVKFATLVNVNEVSSSSLLMLSRLYYNDVPASDCTLASQMRGAAREEEAGDKRGRRGLHRDQLDICKLISCLDLGLCITYHALILQDYAACRNILRCH